MSISFKLFFIESSFIILFSFTVYGEESLLEVKQQLERINRDITDLQKEIYKNKPAHVSENNNQVSSQITVFDMRLRDIENELKIINFNYENLSFEIDDLKTYFYTEAGLARLLMVSALIFSRVRF